MVVECMPREKILEIVDYLDAPTLIISISSWGNSIPLYLAEFHINLIHTEFFNFNDEILELPIFHSITDEDARRIAKTVKKYQGKVKQIYVHCDAGIPRSAGVAAAISKYLNNDDFKWFVSLYCPNMTCYTKVLFALNEEDYKYEVL